MHNGIANTAIVFTFVILLLLLCPPVHSSCSSSRSHSSHPGPAQCGSAVALPEQTASIVFEPLRPPLQSAMPALPCPVKDAAKEVARPWFDSERDSYPTAKYDTFSDAFKSKKVYGPKQEKGKELTKRVVKDPAVRKAFKNAKRGMKKKKGLQLSKAIEQWVTSKSIWNDVTMAGRRYKKEIEQPCHSIAAGEILGRARDCSAEGSALAAAQKEEGLFMYFKLYEEGIHACRTVQRAAEGEIVDPIHNVYLEWDHPDRPRQIAIEQATYNLGLLAGESDGGSVQDILGGCSVEEIHAMSFDDLEAMAFALGEEQAEEDIDADHVGALRFQALATIKVTIDDTTSDLEDGSCAAVPLKDGFGPYYFPTAFEASILVQNCHGGGTGRHGLDPVTESEREWITEADRYLVDKYGAEGYVIDMKAESNNGNDAVINAKVLIPEEEEADGTYARLLNLENPIVRGGQTTFELGMSQGDDTFATRRHHQVLQQVLVSSGRGMRNHVEFNEFLGGQTFEEKYPFTNRDERRYKKLLEDWQEKHPEIEFAEWCDVDHCVGRSKRWMNNVLFTNLCSHRWNQCMAVIRIRAEDWCFGLGTKAYGNGND